MKSNESGHVKARTEIINPISSSAISSLGSLKTTQPCKTSSVLDLQYKQLIQIRANSSTILLQIDANMWINALLHSFSMRIP